MMNLFWLLMVFTVDAAPCMDGQQCSSCGSNGLCISQCNDGYFGLTCKQKCRAGCRYNICHMNNNGNDECTHGCKLGYYGSRCIIPCATHENTCKKCPQECEEGFCQLGLSCAQGCQNSYYGTACKSCPAGCEVCNRVSGTCKVCLHCEGNCSQGCTDGCEAGYFGEFCEHECSSGCQSECNQTSGDCLSCKSGWFGRVCEKQCSHRCIDKTCKIDGNCTNGCIEGWYGQRCETKCQRGCHGGICTLNGTCADGCRGHFYGKHCENLCSASCLNRVCDAEDGTCQSCEKRFYGSHCNKTCVRCKEGFCTQDTGQCSQGCIDGWYGPICESKCPRKCLNKVCDAEDGTCQSCEKRFYGSHCEKSCEGCVGGSCTQDTGQCSQECLPNYKGKLCQHDCGGNCTTEECFDACKSKTQQYWIGGISLIFIVFLVIVVYVTYHFKRIDNKNINRVNWHAETGTVNVEQEDSSSLSESDCSQMGVQVVILKQPDSESIVSLDDEVVEKAVTDRELLKKTIVEENLPSVSYKVSRLDVAGTKGDSRNPGNTGQESEMSMEQDSKFGNAFAKCKMMRDDEKGIASCSDYFSGDRKCIMRTIMEKDYEYHNDADDRIKLRITGKEENQSCDGNGNRKSSQIVEDKLVFDDSVEYKKQVTGSAVDKGPDCVEGASAEITEIATNKDDPFEEHDNDDQDFDVPENASMTYDGNGSTLEAANERQPESAGAVNTEPQVTLNVPFNWSMTYDGNGTNQEASRGRQPESSGAVNTEPQLAVAQVNNITEQIDKSNQSGILSINEHDNDKHYYEVFLMND